MEIKYSKFEINTWDIFFLVIYLSHLLGGIDILFNEKEKDGIFFLVIGISYFVYRFLLVMIIKSKMKFHFSDYEVKIKGLFFEKTIAYNDIKTLTVRKNILGSYDIFLNFDSSINIYKYLCNLITDVSIENNHEKSYVFCDIKNKDEILEYLLEKIGYPKKEIREKVNGEKLYVRYSIFERFHMLCCSIFSIVSIFSVGVAWGDLELMIELFVIIILLLVMTMIKFFRKDYIMKRYSNYSISIFEKKKGIYIVDSFLETDEKVVINYENYFYKRDYYYFQNNVMPKNYKKYDNWNYKNNDLQEWTKLLDYLSYLNGYGWAALIESYLENNYPELYEDYDSDSEVGGYVGRYFGNTKENWEKIRKVAEIVEDLIENEDKIYKYIKENGDDIFWDSF